MCHTARICLDWAFKGYLDVQKPTTFIKSWAFLGWLFPLVLFPLKWSVWKKCQPRPPSLENYQLFGFEQQILVPINYYKIKSTKIAKHFNCSELIRLVNHCKADATWAPYWLVAEPISYQLPFLHDLRSFSRHQLVSIEEELVASSSPNKSFFLLWCRW